jgi:hypothetical protein
VRALFQERGPLVSVSGRDDGVELTSSLGDGASRAQRGYRDLFAFRSEAVRVSPVLLRPRAASASPASGPRSTQAIPTATTAPASGPTR